MNNNSSSSESSNEFFDNTMKYFLEENEIVNKMESVINSVGVPLVCSSFERDEVTKKKRIFVPRDREEAYDRLIKDYFCSQPLYTPVMFRRRFRMHRHVFLRIVETLTVHDNFFQQRRDATGRLGAPAIQKCTAALRMLSYGTSADQVDEYVKLGASTVRECLVHFVDGIISMFLSQYLRKATTHDVERLLRDGERRGFPGMMGSIDCMHWEWKNCPTAWAGQFAGRSSKTTIILEAVASYDLWIWHAFFGTPGACNDINVLQRSPVFNDILEGRAPKVNFKVNGHDYNMGYYLTDGIYPSWGTFVKSITAPQVHKHKLFAQHQESVRKDVERAFGVLQARFAYIKRPCLIWDEHLMGKILMACIIMHNMIVEDERDAYQNQYDTSEFNEDNLSRNGAEEDSNTNLIYSTGGSISLNSYMKNQSQIRSREKFITI